MPRKFNRTTLSQAIDSVSLHVTTSCMPYKFKTTIGDGAIDSTQLGGTPHVGLLADAALKADKGLDLPEGGRITEAGHRQMNAGLTDVNAGAPPNRGSTDETQMTQTATAATQAGDNDANPLVGVAREGINLAAESKATDGSDTQQQ